VPIAACSSASHQCLHPCRPAAPSVAKCNPPGLTNTYIINTTTTGFDDAEATCNRYGGHLVSYGSMREQQAVERCFIDAGWLFPLYNKFYWMGLKTGDLGMKWPNFTWM
jgi:hypothetical protein